MPSRARIHQTADGHELHCPTCGARVTIIAPLPLEEYLREIHDFAAAHEHGVPKVEDVEAELGMGHGAWDTADPEEIIAAVLRVAGRASSPAPVEEPDPLTIRMAEFKLGIVDWRDVIATAASMRDQPSAPPRSTEGDPERLERMRRRTYAVHNHGPDEGPGLACRETLIGDCLRKNREDLHQCVREGYGLFHREQVPGTVGERWCNWAQTLGWPSLKLFPEREP